MKLTYFYIVVAVIIAGIAGVILLKNQSSVPPLVIISPTATPSQTTTVPVVSILPTSQQTISPTANPSVSANDFIVYEKRKEQSQAVIKQFNDKTTPGEKFVWYQALARAELGLKNYEAAKDAYNLALQSDPQDPLVPATKVELAALLVIMGNNNQALLDIQEAVAIQPAIPDYWFAYIAIETDHFNATDTQIQDLYRQAIQKSNNQPSLMSAYASYLEKKGDLAGALSQWQAFIAVYPKNLEAAANIQRLEDLISHN